MDAMTRSACGSHGLGLKAPPEVRGSWLPNDIARSKGETESAISDLQMVCPSRDQCARFASPRGDRVFLVQWMCTDADYLERIPLPGTFDPYLQTR